jgi:hypothetical protein
MADFPIPPTNWVRFRGDTIQIPFQTTLSGVGLAPADLAYIKFTVKTSKKDIANLVQKTLGNGIAIVDGTLGKYMAVLDTTDSPDQTSDKTYYYDIEIKEVGNNGRVTTVMWGNLTLTNDVTK